jgi:hypothetical protein
MKNIYNIKQFYKFYNTQINLDIKDIHVKNYEAEGFTKIFKNASFPIFVKYDYIFFSFN